MLVLVLRRGGSLCVDFRVDVDVLALVGHSDERRGDGSLYVGTSNDFEERLGCGLSCDLGDVVGEISGDAFPAKCKYKNVPRIKGHFGKLTYQYQDFP